MILFDYNNKCKVIVNTKPFERKDPFHFVSDFLPFDAVNALSITSKENKKIMDEGSYWKNLCKKIGIAGTKGRASFQDLKSLVALVKHFSNTEETKGRKWAISYLVRSIVEKKLILDEATAVLSELSDELRFEADLSLACSCLNGDSKIFTDEQAFKMIFGQAELCVKNVKGLSRPKEIQVFHSLQKIIDGNGKFSLRAEYFKGVFLIRVVDFYFQSPYLKAHVLFQKVKEKDNHTSELSFWADYQIGYMQATGRLLCTNSQLANILLELQKNRGLKLTGEMQKTARFFLAEMVLQKRTRVRTMEVAVEWLKDISIDESLSENVRTQVFKLLEEHSKKIVVNLPPTNTNDKITSNLSTMNANVNPSKVSNSEYSFEGTLIPTESDFTRTRQMKEKLKHSINYNPTSNTLYIDDASYPVITSNTRDFFNCRLVSCGSSSSREVILFNPENSPILRSHFLQVEKKISVSGHSPPMNVMSIVMEYVRNFVFPVTTEITSKIKTFISKKIAEKTTPKITLKDYVQVPVIEIDSFISEGLGVCRHRAFVTAIFLDGLIKKSKYFSGIVQMIRGNLQGGAHTWGTCVISKKLIHIDTMWDVLADMEKDRQKLEKDYGKEVIVRQFKKVEKYKNEIY